MPTSAGSLSLKGVMSKTDAFQIEKLRDDDRVQGRPFLVIRLEAVQVHLDQPATRQRLRLECRVDVRRAKAIPDIQ